MPLCSEDEEAADLADLFGLGVGHLLVLGQAFRKHGAGAQDLLVLRLGVAGGLGDDVLLEAGLFEVGLGEVFGVAAEHDIRAAARHVRGYRDGAELARLGDDLRLALVLLGVQDIVLYPALFQQGGEVFALLN